MEKSHVNAVTNLPYEYLYLREFRFDTRPQEGILHLILTFQRNTLVPEYIQGPFVDQLPPALENDGQVTGVVSQQHRW